MYIKNDVHVTCVSIESFLQDGTTLHAAANNGHDGIVKELLAGGSSINQADKVN